MEPGSTRHSSSRPQRSAIWQVIELADRPLLVLALGAVALYLLELRGVVDSSGPVRYVSAALNVVFVVDLLLKIAVGRGRYLRSAWVVTDVLSCLPGISLLANVPWLLAIQFTRIFRVLRILRGLRVLRSLQFMPTLAGLAAEQDEEGKRFRVEMNAGVALYAVTFLAVLVWLRAEFAAVPVLQERAEFFLVLGALLATALFLFLIHTEVHETSFNQLKSLLNIALPLQVADHFLHHPDAYHDRNRAPATTLFIDFVGFSSTAEKLRADVHELAHHLERVMDVVVDRLVAHDLIIDKFIGDAVMAFRGGPLVKGDENQHARAVVRGALEAAAALKELNDPYFSRVKIGGASDECLIGAFGTSKRLSYTALGDGVNLAARLEPASAQCGAHALFCDTTRRLCGETPGIVWRRWGTIRVKGKAEPQVVWEAFDASNAQDFSFVDAYERARDVFEHGGHSAARPLFVEANASRSGGDPPSQLHIDWCDKLAKGCVEIGDTALSVSK